MSTLKEKSRSEETAKEPSKKLGVKYLDDVQLTNSFPDWKALMQRIEEQRSIANSTPKEFSIVSEDRFPQMYDNLYAILGGRGTGKSSVVLTLQHKLKEPSNQNIIFPIITPEVIVEKECSILGWIMSSAESVVTKLENRIQHLETEQLCSGESMGHTLDKFFENCRFKRDNDLRKSYQELFKRSMQPGGINISSYSAEDAVGYRVEQSRRQYKLIQDLNRFWQRLTDTWYEANRLEFSEETLLNPPLIILIFDDIDLVPERSMELLNTTFQYLTNPNIVILLTAAEKVLQDVIHLKMLGRMVGSEFPSLMMESLPREVKETGRNAPADTDTFGSLERMASEFYDKVIPPSSRYRLRRYRTIQDKRLYCYSQTGQSFVAPGKGKTTSIPIEEFLAGQIDRLRDAFAQRGGSSSNFLLGGRNGQQLRRAYLAVFGEKSRNIANGCLEIMNTVTRLCSLAENMGNRERLNVEDTTEVLQTLRHLLQALLYSKPQLNEYAYMETPFLSIDADRPGIQVNYELVMECYRKVRQDIHDHMEGSHYSSEYRSRQERQSIAEAQKKAATLLTLLFFIEGILLTVDGSARRFRGYHTLSRLLNADSFNISQQGERLRLFPRNQNVEDFLDHYPLVLEHIDQYVNVDKYDLHFAQMYLEDCFRARAEKKNARELFRILFESIQQEREWVKTAVTMLIIRYSGITLVDSSFLQAFGSAWGKTPLFGFTFGLPESRKKAAQNFLSASNLFHAAQEGMEKWNVLIKDMSNEDDWRERSQRLIEIFSRPEDGIISLQQYDEFYQTFSWTRPSGMIYYEEPYIAQRWFAFLKNNGLEDTRDPSILCYNLVRFIDKTFEELMDILCTKTVIYLSKEDHSNITNSLLQIDVISEQEQRLKSNLATALRRAFSGPSTGLASIYEDQDNQLRLEESSDASEELWCVSARPLIEYLSVVRTAIERQEKKMYSDPYALYDQPDYTEFFSLISYLAVSLRDENSVIKLGGVDFPLAGCVIMDLKMLEYLFDSYFAAKMQIAIQDQDLDFMPSLSGQEQTLNDKLQSLFQLLTKESSSPSALNRLVKEVQKELSSNYYRYLEEMQ